MPTFVWAMERSVVRLHHSRENGKRNAESRISGAFDRGEARVWASIKRCSLVVLQRADQTSSVRCRVGRSILSSGETTEAEERGDDGGADAELHGSWLGESVKCVGRREN